MSDARINTITDSFVSSLKDAIDRKVATYLEALKFKMIEQFQAEADKELSRIISQVSVELMQMVSFERYGNDLRITVSMPKK